MRLVRAVACFFLQAYACWAWWNYLEARLAAGCRVVRINFDETSLKIFQGGTKGQVFDKSAVQRASLGIRRQAVTYISFVCDSIDAFGLMPQVLVASEHVLPAKHVTAVQAALPDQFIVVRQKSGWNNADLTADILGRLARRLREWDSRVQPILLMDAARLHLHRKVLSTCAREHLWPIVIPPRHTRLLQPLDVDGFASLDLNLQREYQAARTMKPRGDMNIVDFARCVGVAFETSLRHRDWNRIFSRVGFGCQQQNVKESIRKEIGVSDVKVPAGRCAFLIWVISLL